MPRRNRRQWTAEEIAADPDFPHGEARGRQRGCTCEPCERAFVKWRIHNRYMRETGRPAYRPAEPWRKRVAYWLEAGGTVEAIARATGLTTDVIYDLRNGSTRFVLRPTIDALTRTTLDDVLANVPLRSLIPADTSRRHVESLMALGYPGRWIAAQCGYTSGQSNLSFIQKGDAQVTVEMSRKIAALVEEYGRIPGPSTRSRRSAARHGWWPPAAYEEDGTLNLRLLPGHPWREADERYGRMIDALILSTRIGHTVATAADEYGIERERLRHTAERLQARWGDAYRRTVAEIERALDEPDADVVLLGLRAGAFTVRNPDGVPSDHPAAVQFKAERAGVSQAS